MLNTIHHLPMQILVLLTIITATNSLKCHLISSGSLADPNAITTSTSLQECPIGANSCVKTVDYQSMRFSKQCQIGNCTSSTGAAQAPASCFNTSNIAYCCCYGDGCNSSPSMLPFVSSLLAIATSAFLVS